MKRRDVLTVPLMLAALTFACACGGSAEEHEARAGTASSALLNGNALNGNALNGNGLYTSALMGYMLAPNALTPSTLSTAALAAIVDPTSSGDLSRQLLAYTVSCAFDTTQSFAFSWTDALGTVHGETYTGLLGLATDWSSGALGTTEQQWVTACLASRVNYFGTHVTISARGPLGGLNVTDSTELGTYTMLEGAFWGNVFTTTPYAAACDYPTDDGYSRSLYRDCAAGYVDSGGTVYSCPNVVRLGACADLGCNYSGSKTYYKSCSDPTLGTVNQVVTVYLHD